MAQNDFYRVGFCSQCDGQIMVTNTKGQFVRMKANHRQVDLEFDDGHRFRVPLCDGCYNNMNYQTIMDRLCHESSQAGEIPIKELKYKWDGDNQMERTLPVKHTLYTPNHGLNQIKGANSGY